MPFPTREFRTLPPEFRALCGCAVRPSDAGPHTLGAGVLRSPAFLLGLLMATLASGCRGRDARGASADSVASLAGGAREPAPVPDGPPRMINPDPPFRYPSALYVRKVQGNVTLRLWIDSTGQVRPDSTRVSEPSGYPALDSSAVAGSEKLRFMPGMRDGRPTGAAILFPVYFRHPESAPLPGDTVLRPRP